MSYFPERETIDPSGIADALSESLSNKYGSWQPLNPWAGGIQISLDGTKVISRNYSIRAEQPPPNVGPNPDGIAFRLTTPLDMSNLQKFQFSIACNDRGGHLSGNGNIRLIDPSGYGAVATFQFTKDQNWSTRIFTKDSFYAADTFNWRQIVAWVIDWNITYWDPIYNPGYTIWIDAGPFAQFPPTALPQLTISSVDIKGNPITGKSVQLTNPSGYSQTFPLPLGPVGISTGEWTLKILDADFIRWSDGLTSNTRTLTAVSGVNYSFQAIFTGGKPPEDQQTTLIIGAITAAIIASAVLIYFLTQS